MKKLLFLLLPLFAFGQVDSVNIRYIQSIKEYKVLNLKNQDIENLIKCTDAFVAEYSKLLQLDDLSDTTVQKAIIKDYVSRCNSILTKETGNGLLLFKTKENIEKYIILQERLLKSLTSNKIIDYWLAEHEKPKNAVR